MRKHITIGAAALALSLGWAAGANAEEIRSGYYWATVETRAMQDDEFQNPGMIWTEQGEDIWNTAEGEVGKSCADCHGDAGKSMKGVGISYPKYRDELGKMQSLEQRLNECRVKNMKAKPWKWESGPMLSMSTFVRHQSKGMPGAIAIDGPAAPFFEKGKALYNTRMGQLDMACKHCHEDNAGGILRANTLTQGQSNGFPTYRLKWQKVGSIHRRFRGCNKNIRAKPFAYGSDEYVNLELYVAWRGRGLPIETPAVRN